MINVAGYPRKSKEFDNSDSMDAQVFMMREYLDRKYGPNQYMLKLYDQDYGITGHEINKRKDFQRMMKDIKDGKIQLVVIQRYDRIARNTRDFCNIYHDMPEAGCELVSVSQQIDTTTPYGKKFMYDQASMAELEWALCSERRKDANRYARSIGKYNCPPQKVTMGYKVEKIDGVNRLVINRENEPIVRDIFSHFSQYRNYCRCAKYINEKYDLRLTNNIIKRIINTTLYKGEYRENKAFCEPYLSAEEWESLQIKRPVIRDDIKKKNEILFSGMIRCPECGRLMRAVNKYKKDRVFRHYHCEFHDSGACPFKRVKSEILIEDMLVSKVDDFISEYEFSATATEKPRKQTIDKTKKLQKEIERLNFMYQKGRIDDDYYDSEWIRLKTELDKETKELGQSRLSIEYLKKTFSSDWKDTYFNLDKLHRKLFWRDVIREIKVDADMNVVGIEFL